MQLTSYQDTLPTGRHWSCVVRRGVTLTLEDVLGGGNLAMLLYNPENLLERLNLPDSLKAQHTFRITQGHCLYSDMGRIFCSVIDDDLGWHDAASGTCSSASVSARWGESTYQQAGNNMLRNGRDCFLVELAKYGLAKRDLAGNLNWFSRVDVGGDGALRLADSHSKAGAKVVLRFEMSTLVVMHSCPHPLLQTKEYPDKPISYTLGLAEPVQPDDACLTSCSENSRGMANNGLYLLGDG